MGSGALAASLGEILGVDQVQNVVREETDAHVQQFRAMTGRLIAVDNTFFPSVSKPILVTDAPINEKVAAELFLRGRFSKFLANLTAFVLATQKELVFREREVSTYLHAAAKAGKCGEVPCERGCPEKKCDRMCNACPTTKPKK
jgi:hypothetical protein